MKEELVLRHSNKQIVLQLILLIIMALVFWSQMSWRLQFIHLGFDWFWFWISIAAPVVQMLLVAHTIFWRLRVDEYEITCTRWLIPNKCVDINDITDVAKKQRFSVKFMDIYHDNRRFIRLPATCYNYEELYDYLKKRGK